MNKINYISLKKLYNNFKQVIKRVYQEGNEYIIMINKEPKIRISPVNRKNNEKMVYAKTADKEKVKKFID